MKIQRKKELEERLKKRNDDKQLNPIRARAVSNNAMASAAQNDALLKMQDAAGLSPNNKRGGAGSKRRVIGASSVERPQLGQNGVSLTNVA